VNNQIREYVYEINVSKDILTVQTKVHRDLLLIQSVRPDCLHLFEYQKGRPIQILQGVTEQELVDRIIQMSTREFIEESPTPQ
jgi:hypothetical protein